MTEVESPNHEPANAIGAEVRCQFYYNEGGWTHVCAESRGDTLEAAVSALKPLLRMAEGKTAFIRVPPSGRSARDFATQKMQHRGWVRFSFKEEPGEWQNRISEDDLGEVNVFGVQAESEG